MAAAVCLPAAWGQQRFLPRVVEIPGGTSSTLYGTFGGSLVRSQDLGHTWIPLYLTQPGLPQPAILSVEVDFFNHQTLYVWTNSPDQSLWKSTDGGDTWQTMMNGLPASGGAVDFFKQIRDGTDVILYAKKGSILYKSTDRGQLWLMKGNLPTANAVMDVARTSRIRMYLVGRDTTRVWASKDEGHSWIEQGRVIADNLRGNSVNAIHIVPYAFERFYVSIDGAGIDRGSYVSGDQGETFTPVAGFDGFTKIFSETFGPYYASLTTGAGFYRSQDELTWSRLGTNPSNSYTIHSVNPNDRDIVWGLRGGNLEQLVVSENQGNDWSEVVARITPTLAQPLRGITVNLAQGAPYVHSFEVTAFEDASWQLPVTISTSGESWLELDETSGTTPMTNGIRIDTVGLPVGNYQSTITIDSPNAFNQSVSFTVNLTVREFGSVGPQYVISTVAGKGGSGDTRTSGQALDLDIGAPKAVAIGPEGRLWISAGNRLWRRNGTMLNAIAGTGEFASNGDGLVALSAAISDPHGIAFDAQMTPNFAEFASRRVRSISNGAVNTRVSFGLFDFTTGPHQLVIDPFGNILMATPEGILEYNGSTLQLRTAYPFLDPWGIALAANGDLYVSDRGAHRIYRVTPTGEVTSIAGRGTTPGFAGDGGLATDARLNTPSGIARTADGTLYIADTGNQRIRMISPAGIITTVAGSGLAGFYGDGYTAEFASLQDPMAVAVDGDGRVYVADSGNNRVRVLTLTDDLPDPPPGTQPTPPTVLGITRGGSIGDPLSPGAVFSLYGELFGNAAGNSGAIPWPETLAGVSVTINGRPAPIYFVDPGLEPNQINGQIPFETEIGTATVVVSFNGHSSEPFAFPVAAASPGILLFNGNRAVMVNPDGQVNQASQPIRSGEIGVVYLSGIGVPTVAIPTGEASPTDPLAEVNYPYTITVGGQTAVVQFLGYTPGYPTLVQANVVIPNLPPGEHLIVITVNGVASNAALITIGAP